MSRSGKLRGGTYFTRKVSEAEPQTISPDSLCSSRSALENLRSLRDGNMSKRNGETNLNPCEDVVPLVSCASRLAPKRKSQRTATTFPVPENVSNCRSTSCWDTERFGIALKITRERHKSADIPNRKLDRKLRVEFSLWIQSHTEYPIPVS